MAIGNPSFDLFQLSDEHNELRAVLRDLCEKEIAPHAADVDEKARYTSEALAALTTMYRPGANGYSQARNGRGACGSRARNTNNDSTARPRNSVIANPV